MERVAIAAAQVRTFTDDNGKEIDLGYWTLGNRWSTKPVTLDVVDSPNGAIVPPQLADQPESVVRFHQRADLIRDGKIALEDVVRAKADPRLIVVGMEQMGVEKTELMTPAKIEARADEATKHHKGR